MFELVLGLAKGVMFGFRDRYTGEDTAGARIGIRAWDLAPISKGVEAREVQRDGIVLVIKCLLVACCIRACR